MGVLLGSLVAGFCIRLLWPDLLGDLSDERRKTGRKLFGAFLVLGAIALVAGLRFPYYRDLLVEWGGASAKLIFGVFVGYAAANFLSRSDATQSPTTVAATIGVSGLLLLVAAIYDVDDLARRLNSVDTPLIKFELSRIEPARDIAIGHTTFLAQSAEPAVNRARTAAASVEMMILRSDQFATMANYLGTTPSIPVTGYLDSHTGNLFRNTIRNIATCIKHLHDSRPGDNKNLLFEDAFVSELIRYYRGMIQTHTNSSTKAATLDAITIRKGIDQLQRIYRVNKDINVGLESTQCENISAGDFTNGLSRMGTNNSIGLFQPAMTISGLLGSRNMFDEAGEELSLWIELFGHRRSQEADLASNRNDILRAIQTMYVHNWIANYSDDHEVRQFVSQRLTIDIYEEILDSNPRWSDIVSRISAKNREHWTLDGDCSLPTKAVLDPAKALYSMYIVSINNNLYKSWVNRDRINRSYIEQYTDKYLDILENFDYDCFFQAQSYSFLLVAAETYMVVRLNQIAGMDPRKPAYIRDTLCKLASHIPAWKIARNAVERTMAREIDWPAIRLLRQNEQISYVQQAKDIWELLNLIDERFRRIETLIRNFSDNPDESYEWSHRRVWGHSLAASRD